jgi:hypothetical protein
MMQFLGIGSCTENWNKTQFEALQKPFLIRKSMEFYRYGRHIYVDKSGKTTWFDELLNTQMKIVEFWCLGQSR